MAARTIGLAAAIAWALAAGEALADDDPGRVVRLIGAAPSAEDPAAKAFVLDLVITKADGLFKEDVKGWYAALPPATGAAEVTGSCVRSQCAIDIAVTNAKLSLTGDFTQASASNGDFAVADGDEATKITAQGPASYAAITGAVEGVGDLAAPDAVSGAELKSLLEWNGTSVSVGNAEPPTWPDDIERDALTGWQAARNEPPTGLITTADLAALRGGAIAAKAKAGWIALGDAAAGWSAGYPSALLPKASVEGAERRYASADGKAFMTLSIEPPMSEDDFSALVDKLTGDAPGRSQKQYTRVNGDLAASYIENGQQVTIACHNRAGGLARQTFSHPADQDEAFGLYDIVLASSLVVTDDLKAP